MEILLFLSFLLPMCVSVISETLSFEAMYQFGDSMSDTGNLYWENRTKALTSCNRSPYGQTFFHHPTGRCSDGLLILDYYSQSFGLPFLSPYLDKEGNFTHGANFAVTGATALNTTILEAKNIHATVTNSSLMVQLDWFKSHLNTICNTPSECKQRLRNALFLVGEIGANDYNLASMQGETLENLRDFVPDVVQITMHVVKEVINMGAKHIIVPGNFPAGCMIIYLVYRRSNDTTMYDELNCLRDLNEFATFHNDHLQLAIKDLQKEHFDVAIVYADYFSTLISILREAPSLGFDENEMQKVCCGGGENEYNFDVSQKCGAEGVPVCPNPNTRLSWDGLHFTQHVFQLMVQRLLKSIIPAITNVAY